MVTEDYSTDRRVLAWFCDEIFHERFAKLSPQSHPMHVLESIEASSPAAARKALRMTLADFTEQSYDWPPDFVRLVDERLRGAGLPTLSELRYRLGKRMRKVLKRGVIDTEDDYYMLAGLASDRSASMTEADHALLARLLADYENRLRPQPPA
ncbi:hypothetical protein [Massilia sp. METH4]|uniref:hypothetical protein n=1 Tax=Massilia sp. METH4 TaxID=3123041 RepID=UPI0030D2C158